MTSRKRIKVITSAIRTRSGLEAKVRETISKQLEREKLVAARDRAILAIQERHNGPIDVLGDEIEANMAMIEQWAEAHRDEFGRLKSMSVEGHIIGWRTGQPRPATRKGWTWKKVMVRLQELGGELRAKFVRIKEEPNKEAMIAAKDDPQLLAQIGVEIVQSEAFYLDPAREGQAEKRLTAEAA